MRVIAVMPAFNEASRIGMTVAGVKPLVDGLIVVDDGSRDETARLAREAGALVLRHAINRGQGAALTTGTLAALRFGADVIVHVDADGQHDPQMIPSLVQPIEEGKAEVVFGSRFLGLKPRDMPFLRRLLLSGVRAFNKLLLGIPRRVSDPQSGARAMSRAAAMRVSFRQDRMAHCSEILRLVTRSDLSWMEVPIRVRYTGESLAKGQKSIDALNIAWHLLLGILAR